MSWKIEFSGRQSNPLFSNFSGGSAPRPPPGGYRPLDPLFCNRSHCARLRSRLRSWKKLGSQKFLPPPEKVARSVPGNDFGYKSWLFSLSEKCWIRIRMNFWSGSGSTKPGSLDPGRSLQAWQARLLTLNVRHRKAISPLRSFFLGCVGSGFLIGRSGVIFSRTPVGLAYAHYATPLDQSRLKVTIHERPSPMALIRDRPNPVFRSNRIRIQLCRIRIPNPNPLLKKSWKIKKICAILVKVERNIRFLKAKIEFCSIFFNILREAQKFLKFRAILERLQLKIRSKLKLKSRLSSFYLV